MSFDVDVINIVLLFVFLIVETTLNCKAAQKMYVASAGLRVTHQKMFADSIDVHPRPNERDPGKA